MHGAELFGLIISASRVRVRVDFDPRGDVIRVNPFCSFHIVHVLSPTVWLLIWRSVELVTNRPEVLNICFV